MVLAKIVDRVGDSNPQIFRELKERLTIRNLGIALGAAVVIQVFVLMYFNSQLPVPDLTPVGKSAREIYNRYCEMLPNGYKSYGSYCRLNGAGEFLINWQTWWSDVFIAMSWLLPLGLILGSVYTLVADLVQEEKRGTLNFIRLSPQSARTIFIGKILGVPSLIYLAALAALPLHIVAGYTAGASTLLLASWYVTISCFWFLMSSAAVLYVLLGGVQAIVTVLVVAYPVCLPILAVNAFASAIVNRDSWLDGPTQLSWFGLPIFNNVMLFYAFGIGCCLVASYGVWQALERRYLNPTATAISKPQSYLTNLCLQIWIAGFVVPLIPQSYYSKEGTIVAWAVVDFLALLVSIPMLLPGKQALLDWSRYRRERAAQKSRPFWQRDLFQDLMFKDSSPAMLAIAMNIGMAMLLWLPIGMTAFKTSSTGIRFLAGTCLAASLILIYAAIAHLGLFLKQKKRNVWIIAIVVTTMFLPIVGAFVLSPFHNPSGFAAILLLFSPLAPVGIMQLAGGSILATFAAQLAIFAGLTRQLQRKLQVSGQSQTKELLAHSS
ncbi:hypothetical protein [Chamaesiphon minutus]|uniref:Uncharacterized protein n=1 Tax=Chamaesiphon minutus (strain ATCC 27169 / PCC 6605) TaxID=1173020 RepID=K9UIX3_CHAP6|nr:hypothetical protein [Chamaesiphon minutus]AFY94613.1 hypothetical protein Cha6605_3630 [Chamaesiphon minutus PCC 6605]